MQQRLYEITLYLIRQGHASAEELAGRFGVSKRTIYRDLDALSAANVPVYAQPGRHGGIRLLPGFVLDKALFSAEERRQLLSQLSGLTALGTPDTQAAMEKLGALFGPSEPWLEVDFAPWGGGEALREIFRNLRSAILCHNVVEFSYVGSSGELCHRRAEPMKILFRGQGWYLHAFAPERGAYRFFKLSRISNLVLTEEVFTPKTPLESATPDLETTGNTSLLPVELHFTPALAFRVYDEFPFSAIQKQPDGSFLVKLSLLPGDWLLGYLLSFGSGLCILQPASLRAQLADELGRIQKNYL